MELCGILMCCYCLSPSKPLSKAHKRQVFFTNISINVMSKHLIYYRICVRSYYLMVVQNDLINPQRKVVYEG